MNQYLKKFWGNHFQFNWKLGVFLILLFGIPRFVIVLQSYVDRSYGTVMFVFLSMWIIPFILLTKYGRKGIGLKRPAHWWRIGVSFLSGGVICLAIFGLFSFLYGQSVENAFVYIGGNNPSSGITGDVNPEKPDVPLNKNDAFQKVQKRRVQEKR